MDRGTPENIQIALRYFGQALDKDPQFALAHIGTYTAWAFRRQFALASPQEAGRHIEAALAAAHALDDTLPQVCFAWATEATWARGTGRPPSRTSGGL